METNITLRPLSKGIDKPYMYYPILIAGAGETGVCMGARLTSVLKFTQFRIFERKSSLGGTWYTNTYPGIACDVPALMYSYSFAQNSSWTQTFPGGKEIVRYLYDVCAKFNLLDKIQTDTNVKSMRWVDEDEEWEVVLETLMPGVGDLSSAQRKEYEQEHGVDRSVIRTETVRAKIVCSAVGGLVEPKPPIDVPGKDSFTGHIVHTAQWDHSIDFKNKSVVVVGTGCSAGQVVPALIQDEFGPAKHVTQLLRSPPWVTPTLNNGKAQGEDRGRFSWLCANVPGFQQVVRKLAFTVSELEFQRLFAPHEGSRAARAETAKEVLAHMKKTVPEKYHEILTPDYELFCKRRVIDNGWFRSFQDDRVDIDSRPLTKLGPGNRVTIGPGRHYPAMSKQDSLAPTAEQTLDCDVLVMANGYATNQWLHPLDVKGRGGRSLHTVWEERGGAQAYYGTAMDGFPNFFVLFGPNTATGHSSVILASENATNYALHFIKPMLTGSISLFEVHEHAERKWTADLQADIARTVFATGGCVSWYADRVTNWNSTVYPRSQVEFSLRCYAWAVRWRDWHLSYTTKGLVELWARRLLRAGLLLGVLFGGMYTWRRGVAHARLQLKHALGVVRQVVARQLDRITA